MDNNDRIKENVTYTVLDWLRLFDPTLPSDREKAVDFIIRQFRVCEGACPFAPNRRKGICYNKNDPYCQNWHARAQRDEDGHIDDILVARANQQARDGRFKCWDTWYKFLAVPVDEEILAKFREKLS